MLFSFNALLNLQICFRVLHETICDSKASFPFLRASSDGLCTPSICIFRYACARLKKNFIRACQFLSNLPTIKFISAVRHFCFLHNVCLKWLGLVISANNAISGFHSGWIGSWSSLDIDGSYVFRAIWVEELWSSL